MHIDLRSGGMPIGKTRNIERSIHITEAMCLRAKRGSELTGFYGGNGIRDVRRVMGIPREVAILDYGKKVVEGDCEAVQNGPKVIEAYLGRGKE